VKGSEFKSLKERLITVRHHLEKYTELAPEKRTELEKIKGGISDSEFLLQLKGVDDKDLEAPIQEVVDLACGQLSSSIDTAVRKMSRAVLRMQQEECTRLMQHKIKTEERKVLDDILVDFIQVINKVSAGRRPS
jgi:hypothetical protein